MSNLSSKRLIRRDQWNLRLARLLQIMESKLVSLPSFQRKQVWIDVGAHLGELTFLSALNNPFLTVYAFEPNLEVAVKRMGLIKNFVVIPMAVSVIEGCNDFYINCADGSSSLLELDPIGLQSWISKEKISIKHKVSTATMRLDSFMNRMNIDKINYLKVDAQGADLSVVKSAGNRLRDMKTVRVEIQIAKVPMYIGAASKKEMVDYMMDHDFLLTSSEKQSVGQEENLTFENSNWQ